MKSLKRILALGMTVPLTLGMTGCASREGVENAYQVFAATDQYLNQSEAEDAVTMFAEDLCVGGLTNTSSNQISSQYVQNAAVFSVDDEEITYAQNIYEKCYPASTTKILTAYIALKYGDLNAPITVSERAFENLDSGSSLCGLKAGDQITLEQAIYGLMLKSGNEAANVIAEYISGSVEAFAKKMNEEAKSLGATHSHFVNANGLPNEDHYTTAYDLYLIFQAALKNKDFETIISAKEYEAQYKDASGAMTKTVWKNTNGYLSGDYEVPENITVVGGKTGTTNAAGYCLVLYSKNKNGHPVISIVMKAENKSSLYQVMSELLTNFSN